MGALLYLGIIFAMLKLKRYPPSSRRIRFHMYVCSRVKFQISGRRIMTNTGRMIMTNAPKAGVGAGKGSKSCPVGVQLSLHLVHKAKTILSRGGQT